MDRRSGGGSAADSAEGLESRSASGIRPPATRGLEFNVQAYRASLYEDLQKLHQWLQENREHSWRCGVITQLNEVLVKLDEVRASVFAELRMLAAFYEA